MTTSVNDTPELKAFNSCTGTITNSVRNDRNMVAKLFEKGLISNATYDKRKAHKIVSSVRDKIEFDVKNFDVFLDILKEDLYHSDLKSALKEKLKKFRRMTTAKEKSNYQRKWFVLKWIVIPCICILIALILSYYQQSIDNPSTNLRDYYENLEEIDFEQYLPRSMKLKQIPFIIPNVQLADQYPAEVIDVKQLLKTVKSGTRIAITGRPGVGKSTLARYIAKLWANSEALQQFTTLYHICLGRTDVAITDVQQLIMEDCHGLIDIEDLEQEVLDQIKHEKGTKIVFLLDGFDEYIPNFASKKNDFVVKLIQNVSLSKSALIVMSRPRSVDDYKHSFTKLYEVTGFRPSDIETSLLKLEAPLRTSINVYFDNNPNVKKMCYLPLHLTMIIYLASLSENPLSEMDSETKIFKSFLYLTIDNYQERHSLNPSDLDDCERQSEVTESHDSLCSLFISICELAFNATLHNQKTFSSKEIKKLSVNTDFLQKLSLFNIKLEGSRFGSVDVFSFSHQTFRDFMSAYHLILLPIVDQQKMIKKYANKSTFRDLVWKFYFGLQGEKSNGKTLFTLFKSYVKHAGYKQLPSKYYQIDLYPLAYAFETGMHHDEFVDLLDYSKIIGPGNNHSLQFDIKEPMEVRSFFNIEENVNTNVNFFFMKYTLEWTSIQSIRIQLRRKADQNPDPIICSNTFVADVIFNGTSLMKTYCNKTYMAATNYSSAIILELEYFYPMKKVVDPQLVFSLFKNEILTESVISVAIIKEMLLHLLDPTQKSSLRKGIMLSMIFQLGDTYSSEFLTQEELNFLQLWTWCNKYRNTFLISKQHSFNFSELKKLKIQQSLIDSNLDDLNRALRSATKLEVLDLSSNFLFTGMPTSASFDLFKLLPHLQELDLSSNFISLDSLASGLKYVENLRKLNVSGNYFNVGESFGNQLRNLKKLEILDLSYMSVVNITASLKHLTSLRQVTMKYCMITIIDAQQLAHSLSSLKNLKLLDISHNLITEGPFTQLVYILKQFQIEEINLSYNLIRMPISTLGDAFLDSSLQIYRMNLSSNRLCGSDEEFQSSMNRFWHSKLLEIDLSNNNFYFYDKINQITIFNPIFDPSMPATKTIYVRNSSLIKDRDIVNYAGCICYMEYAERLYGHEICRYITIPLRKLNATLEAQLNAIHDTIANSFEISFSELQSVQQFYLIGNDRERSVNQFHTTFGPINNYKKNNQQHKT